MVNLAIYFGSFCLTVRHLPSLASHAQESTLSRGTSHPFLKTAAQLLIFSFVQTLYALETHIGVFMEIFMRESARRIGDQNVLRKVDALMDWSLVLPLVKAV